MNKSDQINELAKALKEFQKSCPPITLSASVKVALATGGSYSFKYAPMEDIVKTIKDTLYSSGLSFSQVMEPDGGVTTILLHDSGQWMSGTINITTAGKKAQDIGSAITYAKRYSLSAILGIVADEDDDGNSHDGNKAEKAKSSPQTPAQPLTFTHAMKVEVEAAKSADDLKALWAKYPTHHKVKDFSDAITAHHLKLTA